ncbi:E3 ubiquitin-protein ligase rhf2a [Stylosanthes scabra]|uniref:E3 ubiquitin-protein ligase rhf2a n=1 Tax=Stylosanthes scabra TaxID=79078 RepID=A0ABU6W9F5_9FABA|nr:E3 ubiquitin-protein ligase rhf2a [Stylosanthes scabra]
MNEDVAGPSDLQSFSDSLRSKFNAMSLRYKESLSKGTRGWKERLFSRNSSVSELGSEVKRELNAGFASVSRLMERSETRENNRVEDASLSTDSSIAETSNQRNVEALGRNSSCGNNTPGTFSAGSDSN